MEERKAPERWRSSRTTLTEIAEFGHLWRCCRFPCFSRLLLFLSTFVSDFHTALLLSLQDSVPFISNRVFFSGERKMFGRCLSNEEEALLWRRWIIYKHLCTKISLFTFFFLLIFYSSFRAISNYSFCSSLIIWIGKVWSQINSNIEKMFSLRQIKRRMLRKEIVLFLPLHWIKLISSFLCLLCLGDSEICQPQILGLYINYFTRISELLYALKITISKSYTDL